ncbi:hypothetical protein NliqN6_3726 [Naganishia liquefaciens]|uniref:Cytochrome c oxidase subunit 6, mitochondrial n=1 Tax=Naganishia liquefaciens TaxID=104408 RepID=A0A8H3YF82_9TREE|nr:hypothetical protein NliqN6_3726 [Naganishia liquefaciens]
MDTGSQFRQLVPSTPTNHAAELWLCIYSVLPQPQITTLLVKMFGLRRIVARPAVGAARMAIASRGPAITAVRHSSGSHDYENESYEAFNSRYQTFFNQVEDVFELQRGLNNCFAYDLVPATEVVEAALRASRKVNDYATAVRILEGVKEKVENKLQYQAYLDELKPVIQELGVNTKEELYNI